LVLSIDPKARFVPSQIAFPLNTQRFELKHALVGHVIREAGLPEEKLPSQNIFDALRTFCGLRNLNDLAKVSESTHWPFKIQTSKDGQLSLGIASDTSGLVVSFI
jgi:hypothetical protein